MVVEPEREPEVVEPVKVDDEEIAEVKPQKVDEGEAL